MQALGLKCGGTLRQRAERLMLAKGKQLEELDKSLFAKGAAPAVSGALLSKIHLFQGGKSTQLWEVAQHFLQPL